MRDAQATWYKSKMVFDLKIRHFPFRQLYDNAGGKRHQCNPPGECAAAPNASSGRTKWKIN